MMIQEIAIIAERRIRFEEHARSNEYVDVVFIHVRTMDDIRGRHFDGWKRLTCSNSNDSYDIEEQIQYRIRPSSPFND
jgi:hypothetical protein